MNAADILELYRAHGKTIGTVESCTGGLLCATLTEIAGSSDIIMGGLITYSNTLKTTLAHVPAELIATHGAVSAEVAISMAEGGLRALQITHCISITGIAGPGGATATKPIGRVHIALARIDSETLQFMYDFGDTSRHAIRQHAVEACLKIMCDAV